MDKQHRTAITGMAASVLRPLIKVLIRHSFSHADLTELVRKSYVEVAYDDFKKPGSKMTYSRAALLSGLSRKEVVRLKKLLDNDERAENGIERRAMRVVNGWLSDMQFMDINKKPRSLRLVGEKGSFTALVAQFAKGSSPKEVLAHLNKTGLTSQSGPHCVDLVSSGYIPQYDEMEKIRVLSVCVSDLFGTAVHNTTSSNSDIRFQRQLVYSGIEESLARQFHDISSEKAMALFQTLNEFLFNGREQSSSELRRSGKRVGLGIYYFEGAKQVKSVKMTSEEHA